VNRSFDKKITLFRNFKVFLTLQLIT